jgi:hypothetical protein
MAGYFSTRRRKKRVLCSFFLFVEEMARRSWNGSLDQMVGVTIELQQEVDT